MIVHVIWRGGVVVGYILIKIVKNILESQSWARWLDSKSVDSTKFGVQSARASILSSKFRILSIFLPFFLIPLRDTLSSEVPFF